MFLLKTALSFAALVPFVAAQAAVWAQCGGIGFVGPTACVSGTSCVKLNDYYSQCQPGAAAPPPPSSTVATQPPAPTTSTPTGSAPPGLSTIPASTLHQISNFGTNPNNVAVYAYKPAKVQAKPPLIVAIHYCSGTAQAYFQGSQFAQLSETHGYVLLHVDSLGIVSAVRYAIANWGVDADRVFVVGTSSGAMMTNVLAGAYPDVFKGGVVDSGVPFACFSLPGQPEDSWNSQCSQGQLVLTGQQWAQRVFDAFPGFFPHVTVRPLIHVLQHSDTTLFPQNFFETVKQWTMVFGYPSTPISNVSEPFLPAGYSNATFGPNFQAILAQGVGHTVPLFEQQYLQFLGIA